VAIYLVAVLPVIYGLKEMAREGWHASGLRAPSNKLTDFGQELEGA
jgi:hypothetical protein